jgi:hypothetical protein
MGGVSMKEFFSGLFSAFFSLPTVHSREALRDKMLSETEEFLNRNLRDGGLDWPRRHPVQERNRPRCMRRDLSGTEGSGRKDRQPLATTTLYGTEF